MAKVPKFQVGDMVMEPDDPSRTLLVIEIKGSKAKVAPFIYGHPSKRLSLWIHFKDLRRMP